MIEKKPAKIVTGSSRALEDVMGCKWTIVVLEKIASGTTRPGALSKGTPGLTPKVLNERLRKLVRFGIIERIDFGEKPPRVEYHLTLLGKKFGRILESIRELDAEIASATRE